MVPAALAASAHAQSGGFRGDLDAATLTLPSHPGSIRGLTDDAKVDVFTGQVRYQVPFELPPGPGGVRPELALTYEGALGNGPYGVGWEIAVPQVRRTTRLGVPGYDPAAPDEMELAGIAGGGRLVEAGDGTYRVEGRGNAIRVEFVGNYVLVKTGDGVSYFMGVTPVSRHQGAPGTFAWMTQWIIHPSGQLVGMSYTKDAGQIYLSEVYWGGGTNPLRARLAWGVRPDPFLSYRPGFAVRTARRLTDVEVVAFGETVRNYALDYDDSLPTSRLVSVEMTGRGGAGAAPSLTFTHGLLEQPAVQEMPGTGGWTLFHDDTSLMDVDGDGINDLVRFDIAGHSYRRNLGDSFAPEAPLPSDVPGAAPELGELRLMDVEGSARPAMVRVVGNRWEVSRLIGSAWESVGTWLNSDNVPIDHTHAFADVDGDNRTDVIQASGSGLNIQFGADGALTPAIARGPVSPSDNIVPGEPDRGFRDMNGDGVADGVWITTSWINVYPGKGNGTFDPPYRIDFPAGLSPGSTQELRLADLNRDGVADVIHVAAGSVTWYPCRPAGLLEAPIAVPRPEPVAPDVVVAFADANGNGSQEVIWSSPRGLWALDLAGSTSAGMLTRIDNGLGQTMEIDYRSSALLALDDELDPLQAPWQELLPVSIPVPVRVDVALASGGPARERTYDVRDGFWDGGENRFGGFLHGVETVRGDGAIDTLVERTTFLAGRGADRVLRGRPARVERENGNGDLLQVEEVDWRAHAIAGLPPGTPGLRVAVADQRRLFHHEGGTSPVEVRTTFGYDGDGNRSHEQREGRVDRTGDESTIERTFAHNDTTWVRGVLVEERTTGAGGVLVGHERRRYDGAGSPLPQGSVERGWLRRVEAYQQSTGQWIAQEAIDHDAAGNEVMHDRDGVRREYTYDADLIFALTETLRPTSSTALTWTAEWDRPIGKLAAVTDPNGVRSTTSYDALARPIATATAGAPPHVTYSYSLAAPRPTTTTTFVDGAGTRTVVAVYDSAGQRLVRAASLGGGASVVSELEERDARGAVRFAAQPFMWSGALPAGPPAGTPGTSYQRDALGRVLVETRPDGTTREVTHEPLRQVTVEAGLAPVIHERDGEDRIVRTERHLSRETEVSEASYTPRGQIAQISLQGGAAGALYAYDTLGRLVSATDSDLGARSHEYDARNRLVRTTTGAGEWVRYAYDDVGRLTSQWGSDGTIYRYHHDTPQTGSPTAQRVRGRLAWVEEPTGTVTLGYDDFGHVASRARAIDGVTAQVTRTWTPDGLLLSESHDDGFAVTYAYDGAGRTVQAGSHWSASALDAAGRVLGETYGNGAVQTYERDALGRTTAVTLTSAGKDLLALTIERTAFGAPAVIADRDGTGLDHGATFGYDDGARLIDASIGGHQFSYAYDALQNMTSRTASGPGVPGMLSGAYKYGGGGAGPRQLSDAGGVAFAYDGAGRMTASGGDVLRYDPFDRLVEVTLASGGTVAHTYGHDGERTATRDAGGRVERRFSPDDVRQDSGTRSHYVRVGDRIVARVDRAGGTDTPRFLHPAEGVAPALVTDAAGGVMDERQYEPYGAPIAGSAEVEPHGAGNRPRDTDTGWADHGARWLAPQLGRWQVPDPLVKRPDPDRIARPWSLNPYQYALSNPLLFWDPDGREDRQLPDGLATMSTTVTGGHTAEQLFPTRTAAIFASEIIVGSSTLATGMIIGYAGGLLVPAIAHEVGLGVLGPALALHTAGDALLLIEGGVILAFAGGYLIGDAFVRVLSDGPHYTILDLMLDGDLWNVITTPIPEEMEAKPPTSLQRQVYESTLQMIAPDRLKNQGARDSAADRAAREERE